jgi:hypothetical protein
MERLTGINEWVMDDDIPPVVGGLLLDLREAFTRSRWVSADDMVGIKELAEFFAVGPSTVTNWSAQRFRNGMPEPLKKLGATPIYSLREVVRWWINWKPSKGAKAGTLPIGIDTEGV